jgi:hypothetical protein
MGFKIPGIELPELPEMGGLVEAGERLMNVAADELPRVVDLFERLVVLREQESSGG